MDTDLGQIKLITVVRDNLTDGQKAVQSSHAAINFCFEYPARAGPWWKDSNYLVQLTCDENRINSIIRECEKRDITCTVFREPDLNNDITAISMLSSGEARKLTSNLPLLFKTKI